VARKTVKPGQSDRAGVQQRSISADIRAIEGQDRTFELSFSSEEPYTRWWGVEILDHSDGALDLTRLNEIGVLLFNHDRDVVIGKILSASVQENRGIATVQFDTDEESEKIYQKVQNGTLKGVSVGYMVDSWEEVAAGKQSADGKYTGPCEVARKWTPFEISIVSVPADPTVGVGRELDDAPETITGSAHDSLANAMRQLQINLNRR